MATEQESSLEEHRRTRKHLSAMLVNELRDECEYLRKYVDNKASKVIGLPTDAKERKTHPIGTGVLDYFPDALAAVAYCSWVGNEQHNPGQPLHWDRSKSHDEADALIRHFVERGTLDTDGVRHSAKVAWRALALLQKEIEREKS